MILLLMVIVGIPGAVSEQGGPLAGSHPHEDEPQTSAVWTACGP
jgi:hypothetical protein